MDPEIHYALKRHTGKNCFSFVNREHPGGTGPAALDTGTDNFHHRGCNACQQSRGWQSGFKSKARNRQGGLKFAAFSKAPGPAVIKIKGPEGCALTEETNRARKVWK